MQIAGILSSAVARRAAVIDPGGKPLEAFRFLRLVFDPPGGYNPSGYLAVSKVQAFETSDGPNIMQPGSVTVTASSTLGDLAAPGVIDPDPAKFWAADGSDANTRRQFLTFDFGDARPRLHHFTIKALDNYPDQAPRNVEVFTSLDGQTYTAAAIFKNVDAYTGGQRRTFFVNARRWRVRTIDGSQDGDGGYVSWGDIYLIDSGGLSHSNDGGTASTSANNRGYGPNGPEGVDNSFDGNSATSFSNRGAALDAILNSPIDFDIQGLVVYAKGQGFNPGDAPKQTGLTYIAEFSTDGGYTWTERMRSSFERAFAQFEARPYPAPELVDRYRLINGPAQGDQFRGFAQFIPLDGQTDIRQSVVEISADGHYNLQYITANMLDDDDYTDWASAVGGGYSEGYIDFGLRKSDKHTITAFTIRARHTYQFSTPTYFRLQRWDGKTYVDVPGGSFTGFAPFGDGEVRTFTIGG